MSVYDLETVLAQTTGRLDLDPTDTFLLDNPINLRERAVELYAHGALVQFRDRQRKKTVPFVAGRNLSGVIDGLVMNGQKDPAQGYVAAVEGHAGFWLMGAEPLTLSNCLVSHVAGDFVYCGALVGGTKARGFWDKPCSGIVLDAFVGIDAGRHRIAAVGVAKAGLVIKANCVFKGWRRAKTDLEAMNRYHSPRGAVIDEGSTSIQRAA